MELIKDDLVDPIQHQIDKYVRELRANYEKMMLDAFALFGYDERWLYENSDRVHCTKYMDRFDSIFELDGKPLFCIRQIDIAPGNFELRVEFF